jgi:hypothetical protein
VAGSWRDSGFVAAVASVPNEVATIAGVAFTGAERNGPSRHANPEFLATFFKFVYKGKSLLKVYHVCRCANYIACNKFFLAKLFATNKRAHDG